MLTPTPQDLHREPSDPAPCCGVLTPPSSSRLPASSEFVAVTQLLTPAPASPTRTRPSTGEMRARIGRERDRQDRQLTRRPVSITAGYVSRVSERRRSARPGTWPVQSSRTGSAASNLPPLLPPPTHTPAAELCRLPQVRQRQGRGVCPLPAVQARLPLPLPQ